MREEAKWIQADGHTAELNGGGGELDNRGGLLHSKCRLKKDLLYGLHDYTRIFLNF